jgi:hypothetical protein
MSLLTRQLNRQAGRLEQVSTARAGSLPGAATAAVNSYSLIGYRTSMNRVVRARCGTQITPHLRGSLAPLSLPSSRAEQRHCAPSPGKDRLHGLKTMLPARSRRSAADAFSFRDGSPSEAMAAGPLSGPVDDPQPGAIGLAAQHLDSHASVVKGHHTCLS